MRSVLILGLLLGMRHALEADHLAAVASLSTGSRNRVAVVFRGVTWGIGHATSLLIVGGLSLGLGLALPRTEYFDRAVGVMLAVLGINVIIRLRRDRVHVHVHRHDDGVVHLHAHRHRADDREQPHDHHHRDGSSFDFKAACAGLLHGLAGSAALLLIVASAMTSRWAGFAYIAVFAIGSMLGMTALSMVIAWPLGRSVPRLAGAYTLVEWLIAVGTIALGVSMMH